MAVERRTLWLGGAGVFDLTTGGAGGPPTTAPTPLNVIVEESPYTTGLRIQVALLAGSPAPPANSFATCLDTPQNTASSPAPAI